MGENINYILVFLEGIFSFFSPCILPLIPVYMGYLAGNTQQKDSNTGEVIYPRKKVLGNTILFVLGISFAFFLLGMSFSAIGDALETHKDWIQKISGVIIIFLGVTQLGVFQIPFFQKEHRFSFKGNLKKMTPMLAFILGFTFSFAWTPCVGPALASVLMLASGSGSIISGNLLVLLYTLGFIIPFLLLGIFTTSVLNFIHKQKKLFQVIVKLAAILLIIMGIITLTGGINQINRMVARWTNSSQISQKKSEDMQENKDSKKESKQENEFDFQLKDQHGEEQSLAQYKGKVVILNFWTTWCTYCKQEMPELQELYEEYGENRKDVIILGIANPSSKENPNAADVTEEEIKAFLTQNKYTYPVAFDKQGDTLETYRISGFPTTVVIDKNNVRYKYVRGLASKERIKELVQKAIEKD